MSRIVSLLLALVLVSWSEAKYFSRCSLASTLLRNGIAIDKLNDWICMAETESGLDSVAVGPPNSNKSRAYGIFQINSYWWCSGGPSSTHNGCNISCAALTNNDITDDIKCAKFIYSRQGFSAWYGWQRNCKGKNLSGYTSGCKL